MAAIKAPKMQIDTAPLKAIESQLDSLDEFLKKRNEIFRRICGKIQPFVRTCLVESLRRSGLNKHSGELERLVAGSVIYPTKNGLTIGPPKGQSEDTYKKMGALQFGYIRKLGVQKAKTRKKIKEAAIAAGGAGVIKAHPYYQLGDAAIRQIENAFNTLLQDELNRFMAAKARWRK